MCKDRIDARPREIGASVIRASIGGLSLRLSTAFHNYGNVSDADASRLAALLVGQMRPAFSLVAPCDPGASAPEYVTVIVKRSTKRQRKDTLDREYAA